MGQTDSLSFIMKSFRSVTFAFEIIVLNKSHEMFDSKLILFHTINLGICLILMMHGHDSNLYPVLQWPSAGDMERKCLSSNRLTSTTEDFFAYWLVLENQWLFPEGSTHLQQQYLLTVEWQDWGEWNWKGTFCHLEFILEITTFKRNPGIYCFSFSFFFCKSVIV